MFKLHFLKEGCLLCSQFIALLLKDMTRVKLLLLIIRLNANMSWMMVLCTEIPGGGQVSGRVVVAPYFLTLYSIPHVKTTAPTISHIKQARVLHTSTADPHGCTSTLRCLILAAVAWHLSTSQGSPLSWLRKIWEETCEWDPSGKTNSSSPSPNWSRKKSPWRKGEKIIYSTKCPQV